MGGSGQVGGGTREGQITRFPKGFSFLERCKRKVYGDPGGEKCLLLPSQVYRYYYCRTIYRVFSYSQFMLKSNLSGVWGCDFVDKRHHQSFFERCESLGPDCHISSAVDAEQGTVSAYNR